MLRITTLVENRPGVHHGLRCEHGLSLYIEKDGEKILFDTGQSDAFIHNARRMGIDLAGVDRVVLSHGHYDHTGGVRALLELGKDFRFFMGSGFFDEKYAWNGSSYEFLGNDFDVRLFEGMRTPPAIVSEDVLEIAPDVFLLSNFPRLHPEERLNPRFWVRRSGGFEQDPFTDELLIAVKMPQGIAVFLGCSHPGMCNMLDAAVARLKAPISLLVGGAHLVDAEGGRLEHSLRYIRKLKGKATIGLSHCTGKEVFKRLQGEEGPFVSMVTGSSLFIG